tara:strand:- start:147 stop:875 length:729 start_codon:yes stop_codon:yes gene_type:complete
MPRTIHIEGDLLLSDCEYIAHQANCRCLRGLGIARVIYDRFPHADAYEARRIGRESDTAALSHNTPTDLHTPGAIQICGGRSGVDVRAGAGAGGGSSLRGVINLFGQDRPGPPRKKRGESAEQRLNWFKEALAAVEHELPTLASIAMPHLIGCGLAGGDWPSFIAAIDAFAERMPRTRVVVVKLPQARLDGWQAEITAQKRKVAAAGHGGKWMLDGGEMDRRGDEMRTRVASYSRGYRHRTA